MIYEGSQYVKYVACGVTSLHELIDRLKEVSHELQSMERDGVAAFFCNTDEGFSEVATDDNGWLVLVTDDQALAREYDMELMEEE